MCYACCQQDMVVQLQNQAQMREADTERKSEAFRIDNKESEPALRLNEGTEGMPYA